MTHGTHHEDEEVEEEEEYDEYDYYNNERVSWYFNAGNSNNVHWVAYDEEESDIIEKYYQERVKSFNIKFGG